MTYTAPDLSEILENEQTMNTRLSSCKSQLQSILTNEEIGYTSGDGIIPLIRIKEKNIKAMNARPGDNSEENLNKYYNQRDTINYYIDYEKKFQRNLETLKPFDKSELFTITGRQFYKNNIPLTSCMSLKLVKEPDNEHDKDAIAVYAEDEKIGYVANNDYTKYELTSSASELQDKIQAATEGYYLFYLDRYADIQFSIGKIN